MTISSTACQASSNNQPSRGPGAPVQAPADVLLDVVRRYGTPTYAYDLEIIRSQVAKLRTHLPAAVDVVYSLKANASLALCGFLADAGLGADVASAGELATALAAGFTPERIFVSGPDKSPAMRAQLRSAPAALLSVDSVSELRILGDRSPSPPTSLPKGERGASAPQRALLRLRPDFCSFASCSAGPDSRFGLVGDELPACRPHLASAGVRVVGFHVFAGSQVLDAEGIIHHMRGALDLALRAAKVLGLAPEIINLGGGFGIPYGAGDEEMDLERVGQELRSLVDRAAPAKLMLELGRYLVAQAGWYLTTVIAQQTHQGRPAVVVDGGTHQRGDMCGLGLRKKAFPPTVLVGSSSPRVPTDVLGCLSLPSDVLAESSPLPPLAPGDVLAFPNAGAYGLSASPIFFHGHPAPAEVAFSGTTMELIRERQSSESVLAGQNPLSARRGVYPPAESGSELVKRP
jgi:diaminopimelate decarboxylase